MTECYEAALTANTTTLIYYLIGLLLSFVTIELVNRWTIRRDRKRIDKLMADSEAELEKYRADHDH